MRPADYARHTLARILEQNPAFGTVAHTQALLAKIHTPTAPGPGGRQHSEGQR